MQLFLLPGLAMLAAYAAATYMGLATEVIATGNASSLWLFSY